MRYVTHVEGLIGHTPLADLTALCATPAAGVRILGKY